MEKIQGWGKSIMKANLSATILCWCLLGLSTSWAQNSSDVYSASREFLVQRYADILTSGFPLHVFPDSLSPNEGIEAARTTFVIKSLTYLGRLDLSMDREHISLRRQEARQEFQRRLSPVIGRLGEALLKFSEVRYSSDKSTQDFKVWFFENLQGLDAKTHSRVLLLTEERTGLYFYEVIRKAGMGLLNPVRRDLQKLSREFIRNLFEEVLLRSFWQAEKEWKISPQALMRTPLLSFSTPCRLLDLQASGAKTKLDHHQPSQRGTGPGRFNLRLVKSDSQP